ncbi:MAG: hypothetical protein AAB857_00030 [Patescibacteria group bacterium]
MALDHIHSLCHAPDREVPLGAKVESFKLNPVHCRCCGTELVVKDYHGSLSFEQLGLLIGACPACPPNESR